MTSYQIVTDVELTRSVPDIAHWCNLLRKSRLLATRGERSAALGMYKRSFGPLDPSAAVDRPTGM